MAGIPYSKEINFVCVIFFLAKCQKEIDRTEMPAKTKISSTRGKTTNQSSWTQWRIRSQMDKNWHKVILLYSRAEDRQQSLIYILPRFFHRSHRYSNCPRCIIHWLTSQHSSEVQKYQLHLTNKKLKHIKDKENCHLTKGIYSQKKSELSLLNLRLVT